MEKKKKKEKVSLTVIVPQSGNLTALINYIKKEKKKKKT